MPLESPISTDDALVAFASADATTDVAELVEKVLPEAPETVKLSVAASAFAIEYFS